MKNIENLLSQIRNHERREFFEKQEKLGDENLNAQLLAWCEKLESGEYKQADGALYDDESDSYCCLGVAGIVCEVETEAMTWLNYPDDNKIREASGETLWTFLQNKDLSRNLAELNDTERFSFKEISTLIRYKYNL